MTAATKKTTTVTHKNSKLKAVPKPAAAPSMLSGLGLSRMGDLAGLLDAPTAAANGGPIELSLDLIDEDPNQPRHEFDPVTLAEMADTIRERRVKTPISVRPNPDSPGRYIINHGARRFRASNLAGKTTIPAFVDSDYTEDDQVIENIQRDNLTPREIAEYIGRKLAKKIKKGDIAKAIGKSNAFVSQHVTLLDLPEPIADAFNNGRVSDVTVVNELVKAYEKNSSEVAEWLGNDTQEITRGTAKLLRQYLDEKDGASDGGAEPGGAASHGGHESSGNEQQAANGSKGSDEKQASKDADPDKLKKAIVQVQHDGRPGRLLLTRRPPSEGYAWIKYEDDGHEFEARLADVQLVALLEA